MSLETSSGATKFFVSSLFYLFIDTLFIYLFIYLSIYLSIYLFIYLFILDCLSFYYLPLFTNYK